MPSHAARGRSGSGAGTPARTRPPRSASRRWTCWRARSRRSSAASAGARRRAPAATTSKCAPSRSARRCAWRRSARAEPSSEKLASGTRASSPILSAASPRSTYSAEALAARLVEHGLAAVMIGHLAEAPHELLRAGVRADRIAERNPAAAGDLIHDEGIAGVAEQQALVARERGVGQRQVGGGDERPGTLQVLGAGHRRLGSCRPQHVEQHVGVPSTTTTSDARSMRGALPSQRERPPQLVRVVDVAVGDEADPHGHHDDADDADHPHRRERLGENRRRSVERAAAEHEHPEHQRRAGSASSKSSPFSSEAKMPATSSQKEM